jgi:hypothetical protein
MQGPLAAASAEYMAQFRTDVEGFLTREAIQECINAGVHERKPDRIHTLLRLSIHQAAAPTQ